VINRKIARRYAKALLNIGEEDGGYETYLEEIEGVASLLDREHILREVLVNPAFDLPQRRAILSDLASRLGLSPVIGSVIQLLLHKNRLIYLPDIAAVYRDLVDEMIGRARAYLVTAYELPPEKVEDLADALETLVQKKVVLRVDQDPSLIGGVVATIGDRIYDGSLKTQLANMRQRLAKG